MCPCARGPGRRGPRTVTDAVPGGLFLLLEALLSRLRPAASGWRVAVVAFAVTGAGTRLVGCECVGDAVVGGVGLAVDAVGVDLKQDGDAVPGAAGDLGRRDAGVQP